MRQLCCHDDQRDRLGDVERRGTTTITFTIDQSLAEVVTVLPASMPILESFGVEYCCGSHRLLGDACQEAGVDVGVMLDALAEVEPDSKERWQSAGLVELVDHIVGSHHTYLHYELDRLDVLAADVAQTHGGRHREATEVRVAYAELRDDLGPHLAMEERVIFPMIRNIAAASPIPVFQHRSLRNQISIMMSKHEHAVELLSTLRSVSDGYQTPPGASAVFKALYNSMARLEADMQHHMYEEDRLLLPAVMALEERATGR